MDTNGILVWHSGVSSLSTAVDCIPHKHQISVQDIGDGPGLRYMVI